MRTDCHWCRIVRGEDESLVLYEDEEVLGLERPDPEFPLHVVLIPKRHAERGSRVLEADPRELAHLMTAAAKVATDRDANHQGYRLILEVPGESGTALPHAELHLVGEGGRS